MGSFVSLLTDFGNQDSYVAEVKAVLLSLKDARLIDISHEIPPFDIRAAAFQLLRSFSFFPKGTVHLTVVDPGVGTSRKAIYVRTQRFHFIGPDNGVLLWAVRHCEKEEKKKATAFEIPIPKGVSCTFHGRDVFAPFVVDLLKRKSKKLKAIKTLVGTAFPEAQKNGNEIRGEIVGKDRFGNIITSIPCGRVHDAEAQVGGWRGRLPLAASYSEIQDGHAALVRGSHGFWEIASKNSSAWQLLNEAIGDRVTLFIKE